jgi:dihydroflavonol-4-reductase
MKRAFVTGATGFVGSHLARALLERGVEVRCLVRDSSPRDNLTGLGVTTATGDLRDLDSLRRGIDGCDAAFHCAADYRLFVPDPESMYASNVEGTRNVMRAAADCGVERLVYTSTVGALGIDPSGKPADERTPVRFENMIGHYKKSKFLAERLAEEWAGRGLPVVIVNPSAPVGDADIKPTATGQMILDFLDGRMRAYVDTGLNLVDVRDVAQGHLLAAERGRVGEKYILGNRNLSLKAILEMLAEITGIPAPTIKLPHWVPLAVSAVDTTVSRLARRRPRVSIDAVRLSRHHMYFDSAKAIGELGCPQTPVEQALQRAVAWFETAGYSKLSKVRASAG